MIFYGEERKQVSLTPACSSTQAPAPDLPFDSFPLRIFSSQAGLSVMVSLLFHCFSSSSKYLSAFRLWQGVVASLIRAR